MARDRLVIAIDFNNYATEVILQWRLQSTGLSYTGLFYAGLFYSGLSKSTKLPRWSYGNVSNQLLPPRLGGNFSN